MSCVIHLVGDHVDVDLLVALCPVEPGAIFRKGETRKSGSKLWPSKKSGISFVASEADFDDFKAQKSEALSFLKEHLPVLKTMRQIPGIDHASIDFGIQRRDVVAQSDAFEPELTGLVAELGLLLVLSQYPISPELT